MCDYQGHEFGASYPDSVCIDGFLWDADSGYAGDGGWYFTNGGEIPCPQCNAATHAKYCQEDEEAAEAVGVPDQDVLVKSHGCPEDLTEFCS